MLIQFNTDNNVSGKEEKTTELSALITKALKHHTERLTRVEVHLSDVNGDKITPNDIKCVMEARPEGLQPLATTNFANNKADAVKGAAEKMKSMLDTTFGKIKNH
jgi:hypothetical protein